MDISGKKIEEKWKKILEKWKKILEKWTLVEKNSLLQQWTSVK